MKTNLNDLKSAVLAGRVPVESIATNPDLAPFERTKLLRSLRREAEELLKLRFDEAGLRSIVNASDSLARKIELGPDHPHLMDLSSKWVAVSTSKCRRTHESDRPQGFAMRAFPVMVWEFLEFTTAFGYNRRELWVAGGFGKWEPPLDWDLQVTHPTWPVTGISWFEATAFATWSGARLPSEREWQIAARGEDGRTFPWGNRPPATSQLNCYESGIHHLTPVDAYQSGATPSGIFDLSGNCGEWCAERVTTPPQTNSQNLAEWNSRTGEHRSALGLVDDWKIIRGGSFNKPAAACRTGKRFKSLPYYRYGDVGFRLVRD